MASDLSFVEFVVEQIQDAGSIRYRKMFGEYALYCNDKVVALVCGNQLFVKPTKAGESLIENVLKKPAYPGAKPSFLVDDQLEDRDWMSALIRATSEDLPDPKPKSRKAKKKSPQKSS